MGAARYRRDRVLGEGTFGKVHLAFDAVRNERKVAVKSIKPPRNFIDGVSWTALREIKILREVSHENIVNLLDVFVYGTDSHTVHLVFEFCPYDLERVVKESGRVLSSGEIASYTYMLLSGLEALHAAWVLHRDLKPSNLLIAESGVLKIGDFGLARVFAPHPEADRVGEMTSTVVTLWYRAPELLFGARDYGPGVDMWSVGCILYELVSRRAFFEGDDDSEIKLLGRIFERLGTPTEQDWPSMTLLPSYMRFERVPPTPMREHLPAAPGSLVDLLSSLLRFDPATRISCTAALAHPYFTAPDAVKRVAPSDLPRPVS